MIDDELRALALVPRDGFFFKDGRGWYTSATGRGHALDWPYPSTIRGALRSAYGKSRFDEMGEPPDDWNWQEDTEDVRIRAIVPLRRELSGADADAPDFEPLWPVPRDALYEPGERTVHRLRPRPPEDWSVEGLGSLSHGDSETLESLWHPAPPTRVKPGTPPRWWPSADFAKWLAGDEIDYHDRTERNEALAMPSRTTVRLSVDRETGTAADGELFSIEIVEHLTRQRELRGASDGGVTERFREWAIGVLTELPGTFAERESATVFLGGKRRIARAHPISRDALAAPQTLLEAFERTRPTGLRLVAVTPLYFEDGWLPPGFRERDGAFVGSLPGIDGELVLRSAIVPRPAHVSGWDMAAGKPKPTRRLVAPGSVYFFERRGEGAEPFGPADAEALWMAALGGARDDGFGCVVPGVWAADRR